MRDPNQKMRFSQSELELLKATFAENDDLLYLIRKAFLQFRLSESERETLRNTINTSIYDLLVKTFNPQLDYEAPLMQLADLVVGLGSEIKDLSPDGAWPFIKAKEVERAYIEQQLRAVRGEDIDEVISLKELARLDLPETQKEQAHINILARNFLLVFIDHNLHQLKVLAGLKNESVEQTIKKLQQNSNK